MIHSFNLVSLGIRSDVIPGRVNSCLVGSNVVGSYFGQCTELCGSLHSFMPVRLIFAHLGQVVNVDHLWFTCIHYELKLVIS